MVLAEYMPCVWIVFLVFAGGASLWLGGKGLRMLFFALFGALAASFALWPIRWQCGALGILLLVFRAGQWYIRRAEAAAHRVLLRRNRGEALLRKGGENLWQSIN